MIPKNMKIGDTFVDDGYTYVVDKIVPLGYESHRITSGNVKVEQPTKAENIKVSEEETPSITEGGVNKYSKTQVNRMPNSKLEEVCKELGLEVGTGTEMKRAIIAKLGL